MSDTPQHSSASSEELNVSRETSQVKETAPSTEKNKPSSFYIYLVVLFGAAFLMLLLAYFVQQRNNATAMDDLRSINTASRQELLEDIGALEEEKLALEARIAELEEKLEQEQGYSQEFQMLYDGARDQASNLEHTLYERTEAMELFLLLDDAYAQGKTQRCLELIEWMEKSEGGPLKDFLPDEADRDSYNFGVADGLTPAQRYQEIYEKLS